MCNQTKVSKTVRHSIQYGLSSTLPHLQYRLLNHQHQQKLLQPQQNHTPRCAGGPVNSDRSSSSSSSGRSSSIGSCGGGGGGGHIIGFNSGCFHGPPQRSAPTIQRCHSHHHLPNVHHHHPRQQQQQQGACSSPNHHLQPPLLATQYAAPLMHFMQPSPGSRGVRPHA